MNLTNTHIITINHTDEYYVQAIDRLKSLNLLKGTKITFGGEKGAFISQANFGDLDYSSNDPATNTITLTYDYAILEY
jgi:hypothetical protein